MRNKKSSEITNMNIDKLYFVVLNYFLFREKIIIFIKTTNEDSK